MINPQNNNKNNRSNSKERFIPHLHMNIGFITISINKSVVQKTIIIKSKSITIKENHTLTII